MPSFISGLEVSHRFYGEVVGPILAENFPALLFGAALIGPGSEVLGFDTSQSRDHDWGARLFVFLRETDRARRAAIADLLSLRLPPTFLDCPVDFSAQHGEPRMRAMLLPMRGPVHHRVVPITVADFVRVQLGYDLAAPLTAADWLTFPSHTLGELTAGAVFHDATGEVTAMRQRFAWYPDDVWLLLLAAGWQRIGEEEHLMPRAGAVGDELGSAIIGSRLIRDIMRLCFLFERRYAPYAKWLGTAFNRLACGPELAPLLWQAQVAPSWQAREAALCQAYTVIARLQNGLGLTQPLPTAVSAFHTRPYRVIHGEAFARALVERIRDPDVQRLAQHLIGNIDQWSDNIALEGVDRLKRRALLE
jgi:hypothetical protein